MAKTKRKVAKPKKRRAVKKLEGFTKTGGKFKLVFKSGSRRSLGKSSYSTKAGLVKAAKKFLKK